MSRRIYLKAGLVTKLELMYSSNLVIFKKSKQLFLRRFTFVVVCIFAALITVATSIKAQTSLRRAMDYDLDQKTDAAVFRASNNTWYIAKSGGGFMFQPFGTSSSDFLVPGDYDSDQKGDIAVWRDSTGTFYYIRSMDGIVVTYQFGLSDDEPVARDYDGDGKTDFAVVRRSNGQMIWHIVQSSNNFYYSVQFGISADFVAPGDYDGDGKFDIAVFRDSDPSQPNSQAIFYILRSRDGLHIASWGADNDLVVPGDYDGDNKTDIAVVRDTGSSLVWYIYRSSDGNSFVTSWGLGGGSDFPVQGYYDSDAKTDVAIWRNSEGTFYIQKSSDFNLQAIYWGSPGDLPVAVYDVH
jgi:hypothetical protein